MEGIVITLTLVILWSYMAYIGVKRKSMEREHEKNLDSYRKGQLK